MKLKLRLHPSRDGGRKEKRLYIRRGWDVKSNDERKVMIMTVSFGFIILECIACKKEGLVNLVNGIF